MRYLASDRLMAKQIVVVVAAASLAISCGDDDGGGFPTDVALEDVIEETRTITDSTRATPPNGDFAGRIDRVLETRLWYAATPLSRPACRGSRCRLVLLAHGFGGRTERFDAIGQRLAAAGYIAVAVAFPLTNQDAPGGFNSGIGDVREQPQDLSVVVNALLEASNDPGDPLYQRVDDRGVGAMGHSLGGTTVIAATRSPCCADSRIAATVFVEPAATAVAPFFGEPFGAAGPPTLTFQGDVDFPIPPQASRDFHAALEAPKILIEMVGGNHVNMIERFLEQPDPLLDVAAEVMIAFYDTYLSGGGDRLEDVFASLRDDGHTVAYVAAGAQR